MDVAQGTSPPSPTLLLPPPQSLKRAKRFPTTDRTLGPLPSPINNDPAALTCSLSLKLGPFLGTSHHTGLPFWAMFVNSCVPRAHVVVRTQWEQRNVRPQEPPRASPTQRGRLVFPPPRQEASALPSVLPRRLPDTSPPAPTECLSLWLLALAPLPYSPMPTGAGLRPFIVRPPALLRSPDQAAALAGVGSAGATRSAGRSRLTSSVGLGE